jgi:trk system potassium uptake protein TrkH
MDLRSVFFVIGAMVSGISALMVIPAFYEGLFGTSSGLEGFLVGLFISGSFGVLLILINYQKGALSLNVREAFILTFLSWIFCCVFASVPIFLLIPHCTFVNAVFEAVSALTTTGFSVLEDFDSIPKGIFLWRSILQWIGGIGIVVMAITIFPILRIGGMQLFRSEFSDRSEKILPRVSQIAAAILLTYTGFMLLGCFALSMCGMNYFDAFCHSTSAISTGGLSTKIDGLVSFDNIAVEIIVMILMIVGGTTLLLFVRLWRGDLSVFKDQQLIGYLKILLGASILLSALVMCNGLPFFDSIRIGFFSSISVITSTGLVLFDYMQYGAEVIIFIFFLSFIGGCTGSTTGGIKIFRFQILASFIRSHLKHLLRPHGVFLPLYQGQKISENLVASVFSFVGLYMLTVAVMALLLTISGLDFVSGLSGAASCLGNVGIGVGKVFGPSGSPETISISAKILLIITMILGRLELLTVLVFLLPSFWKR